MKYLITINQKAIVDGGFHEKTDLADWAIIDYIMAWQLSPKANRYGDMIWLNYRHLIAEMPLLGINTKSSISARITKLKGLSLLESEQLDDGRLYVKTTETVFNLLQFPDDGIQPPPTVHNAEQGVRQNEQGVRQNEQGVRQNEQGVRLNEHSTINKNIQLNTTTTTTTGPAEKIEPVAEKKSGGGRRGGFGENEIVFGEGFTKTQQETFLTILLPVVAIELKQQAVDVLTANSQAKRIRNTPEEFLSALVRRIQAGTFDPSPGFAIAEKRKNKAGDTGQRQVAELEAELNGLIRINGQGLLDAQIAKKQQKLAELKASRSV